MPIYTLTLQERKEVARDTMVFVFSKPADFTFKAGQYGGFTHINPCETDDKGITRRFSLLSAPTDDTVSIATRIQTSAYKRVLKKLPLGGQMKFAGPTGNFILHEDTSIPAVLIAGGIGITPFYSMIQHSTIQHSAQKLLLLYGNQSLPDTAFLSELALLEQQNTHFKCVTTIAQPDANWSGETGFISYGMIKKYVTDVSKPIFYVCGSPGMVNALRETLNELEISEERIRVEDFPGY